MRDDRDAYVLLWLSVLGALVTMLAWASTGCVPSRPTTPRQTDLDAAIVQATARAWQDVGQPWDPRCRTWLDQLRVDRDVARCWDSVLACYVPSEHAVHVSPEQVGEAYVRLLVHEIGHPLMRCSYHAIDGDPEHRDPYWGFAGPEERVKRVALETVGS